MAIEAERDIEIAKYEQLYREVERYRMSDTRRSEASMAVSGWAGGSILDISCGRGEMLEYYKRSFYPVHGTETIEQLCDGETVKQALGHALPFVDGEFHYATCWDVIEHLVPGDELLMFDEMERVACKGLAFSINNLQNNPRLSLGHSLHINIKAYPEWDRLVRARFPQAVDITWASRCSSPIWVVTF
jgi:ubiquinone/menaquinone biosynthesis C-methylase UbiE